MGRRIDAKKCKIRFITGSQHLYGEETLKQVAANSRAVVEMRKLQDAAGERIVHSAEMLDIIFDTLYYDFNCIYNFGGTTDALLVRPDATCGIACEVVAHSLDLKAGQLIDRVGGMLGLPFPAGPALEKLALEASQKKLPKASMDGACCHLSGVQNQCETLLKKGASPAAVARFCLSSVEAALTAMTETLLTTYGDLPLLYAGGVMSNSLLREHLTARFGGSFAPPAFSADNAAGIAVLCRLKEEGEL